MNCKHCKRPINYVKRGLCSTCYADRSIRKLYPKQSAFDDPSMEELDAMIAERMKRLPSWWFDGYEQLDVVRGERKAKR